MTHPAVAGIQTAPSLTAVLPVSVTPQQGESMESWLEHLADANGLTTAQLLVATGRNRAGTRYLTLAPSPNTVARLAALARVDEQAVYAATLARFDGTALDLAGLDPTDRHSYRQVAARGWTPAHGTQICPACLAQTGDLADRVAAPAPSPPAPDTERCSSPNAPPAIDRSGTNDIRISAASEPARCAGTRSATDPHVSATTTSPPSRPTPRPRLSCRRSGASTPPSTATTRRGPRRADRQPRGIPDRPATPDHPAAPPRRPTRRHRPRPLARNPRPGGGTAHRRPRPAVGPSTTRRPRSARRRAGHRGRDPRRARPRRRRGRVHAVGRAHPQPLRTGRSGGSPTAPS
jgi:hypothetical protein